MNLSLRNCMDRKIMEYNHTAVDKTTMQNMVDQVLMDLHEMCQKIQVCHGSTVQAFGSSVNGFGMGKSDVDTKLTSLGMAAKRRFLQVAPVALQKYKRRATAAAEKVSENSRDPPFRRPVRTPKVRETGYDYVAATLRLFPPSPALRSL